MSVLVSIITAAYRAEAFIARAVRSALAQTYPHWEMVIASDDGQDYEAILGRQGIADARIVFTSTGGIRCGQSIARNAALVCAKGDCAAVLDADDAFASNKLERILPSVKAYGAATSDIILVNSETTQQFPSLAKRFAATVLNAEDYILANIHTYSLLAWNRARINLCWDEDTNYMEDMLAALGVYDAIAGIYYTPDPLHYYYKHASSVTNQQYSAAAALQKYDELLSRVATGSLTLKNAHACKALTDNLTLLIALEKKFALEVNPDPVMGWYNFLSKNTEALGYKL